MYLEGGHVERLRARRGIGEERGIQFSRKINSQGEARFCKKVYNFD